MESFSTETESTNLHTQYWHQPQVILSMVLSSLTFLLGVPSNGLVLWITGLKMRRTVNTVWFLHLTLADFLCCLTLPFSLAHVALQDHWPYGRFLCKVIPSVIIFNMFASVFLLTAISLDRCLLVLQPVWCQNHRTVKIARAVCGCIWVVALVMCIPAFIFRETNTQGNYSICGYYFDHHRSSDYSDYHFDLLGNETLDNAILQLLDHPSLTFQRRSEDSLLMSSAELSSPRPNYNFESADMVPSTIPHGFPTEEHRKNQLDNSDVFHSTNSELLPSDSFSEFYGPELEDYFQNYSVGQYANGNPATTPLGAMTITRLVVGFLLPFLLMMVCYSLIIIRMRQGRFAKSGSKTFRVAVVVVVVFFVCWAPYHIFGVLLLFVDPETPFGEALYSWDRVSLALASANSCFNPFLYTLLGKDFRKQAKQSMQGILEAAFSEEATHSTSYPQNKVISERNSCNTAV